VLVREDSLRTKFRGCSTKETFLNLWLNGGDRENVLFSKKNWPYFGNGER